MVIPLDCEKDTRNSEQSPNDNDQKLRMIQMLLQQKIKSAEYGKSLARSRKIRGQVRRILNSEKVGGRKKGTRKEQEQAVMLLMRKGGNNACCRDCTKTKCVCSKNILDV